MPTEMYTIPGEYTGVGSAYQVFKQYYKGEQDASGYKPVFITPEAIEQKKKSRFIN
jgi:hypothetical protein